MDSDHRIAVGYRINSVLGTKFRQWATKTFREHIEKGYTFNRHRIKYNHEEFVNAVEKVKSLLPEGNDVPHESVLELIKLFANTWFSLDAYDRDLLEPSGSTKRKLVSYHANHFQIGMTVILNILSPI